MWRTDVISWIGTTLRKADKIEEYKQILDLQSVMLEMQSKIVELNEENKKLKQDLEIKGKITFKNNFYYVDGVGPYCSRCYDVEKKMVRAHPINDNHAKCPECEIYLNYTWIETRNDVITPDYSPFL